MFVTNSTFSGNNAVGGPYRGGIQDNDDGMLDVKGTILANSLNGNCGNISGTFDDKGDSISDDPTCGFCKTGSANNGDEVNPMLAPFPDNGGPTMTLAIPSNSPAADAIPHASCIYAITPNPCTTSASPSDQLTCDQPGLGGRIPRTARITPVTSAHSSLAR